MIRLSSICFHFTRQNVYSAWETIGAYVASYPFSDCKYDKKYVHITKMYRQEIKKADNPLIVCSDEFMEQWRQKYQDPTSVICPIIKYYGEWTDSLQQLKFLYNKYVGNETATAFAKLGLMLRNKEAYCPILHHPVKDKREAAKQLREAGLI